MASSEKDRLLADLLSRIDDDLASLIRTQQDTRSAATHEENRAEHAKDTRATEQGYLARGLAARVEELRSTHALLAASSYSSVAPNAPVAVGSIARIAEDGVATAQSWWLVPVAGGIELSCADGALRTLTPTAPLGRALLGLRVGDEGEFATPRGERRFEVLEVR